MDDDDNTPETVLLLDARIIRIYSIDTDWEWLCPLIQKCDPQLPMLVSSECKWTLEKSIRRFKGLAVSTGERSAASSTVDEEPLDLEAVTLASGVEKDEVSCDLTCERRFKSLLSTLGARAKVVVEYTPSYGGNARSKRARQASRLKADVTAFFPILSSSVRYDIAAFPVQTAGQIARMMDLAVNQEFDATKRGSSVLPSTSTRVSIGEFSSLLRTASMFHENPVNTIVRSLFPTVYNDTVRDEEADRVVHKTLKGPQGGALDTTAPLTNTCDVAELRSAIAQSSITSMLMIDNAKAYFPTVSLFFYPTELRLIADAYSIKNRWFDILVRGRTLIQHLTSLLNHSPHILNVKKLKFLNCAQAQSDIKAEKRKAEKARATAMTLARFDLDCAAMRGLLTLPERTFAEYNHTTAANEKAERRSTLPAAEQPVVRTALDIYTLLLHDQSAQENLYADKTHETRVKMSEHGMTSGHMFSVIDSTPRAELVGCDRSCSLGAVALDDWQPLPPQSLPPWNAELAADNDDDDGQDDTVLSLPRIQSVVAESSGSLKRLHLVRHFNDGINRLAVNCSPDEYVAGMRWLIEKNVVTRVPMVGTGPYNSGQTFDAFYLSSVHADQRKLVAIVSDIYNRGVIDAVRRYDRKQRPDYNLARETELYRQRADALREKIVFFDRARQYLRALNSKHADFMARSKKFQDIEDMLAGEGNRQEQSATEEKTILMMAQRLHEQVKAFVAGTPDPVDPTNPYADLLPPPVDGERTLDFCLLRNPNPPDFDGEVQYVDEQKRAIFRLIEMAFSIIAGPAGTGKTAVLEQATSQFSPDQVIYLAFTGKVVCELIRRAGGEARTFHSLLYSELLHQQEVQRTESILSSLSAMVRASGQPNSMLGQIVEIRKDLYRILGACEHPSPLENKRCVVIDEGSLVSFSIFYSAVMGSHLRDKRIGRFLEKIVVTGDPNQLFPIGYGSVLSDFMHAYPWCVQHMTINHRSSGGAIFKLASAIARQQLGTPEHPFPQFGGRENEVRLLTSTSLSAANSANPELVRRAKEASVVFMNATSTQMLPGVIASVLDYLGVLQPKTEAAAELRKSILMIASTRNTVGRLNDITRNLFFADTITRLGGEMQMSATGEMQMPTDYTRRILPGDRIILKRNWREYFYVDPESCNVNDQLEYTSDRIMRLDTVAEMVGLRSNQPLRRVVNMFYNGELLEVVCFYDTPRILRDDTWCRCGLCPPRGPSDERKNAYCMTEPHNVPLGRRIPTNLDDPRAVKYHNQNMRYQNGALQHNEKDKRRMIVFRVLNDDDKYKEVDVGARLANQSQFAFVQAATVHVFQGSEAKVIIYAAPFDNPYVDWTAVYTAVTRPRDRLIVVGDPVAFQKMIQRQPTLRRSDLYALLAIEACAIHRAQHRESDPLLLAKAMKIDDDALIASYVDTRRTLSPTASRRDIWAMYERFKEAVWAELSAVPKE